MAKKVAVVKGFGKDIPPDKEAVIIWFVQRNSSEDIAMSFFNFYALKHWRNNRGQSLKDWKMRAWDWIWNRKI